MVQNSDIIKIVEERKFTIPMDYDRTEHLDKFYELHADKFEGMYMSMIDKEISRDSTRLIPGTECKLASVYVRRNSLSVKQIHALLRNMKLGQGGFHLLALLWDIEKGLFRRDCGSIISLDTNHHVAAKKSFIPAITPIAEDSWSCKLAKFPFRVPTSSNLLILCMKSEF